MTFINSNAKDVVDAVFHGSASLGVFEGDCFEMLHQVPSDSIDLIFSSPPYCMGKAYESTKEISDFVAAHEKIFKELVRILKPGGSLCWQVGMHVKNGVSTPLDSLVYMESLKHSDLKMRNRIVWTFGHGLHCTSRFSGRHETVLWFTKGDGYNFNLDHVRVAQKYPGKTSTRGKNKGRPSGNPLGKNPGDVWNIPNVKQNHVEKTIHPCQFPVALPQIFIRALAPSNGLVFDPFSGSGTTGVASILEGRRFLGAEICPEYNVISTERFKEAAEGVVKVRPWYKEVAIPNQNSKVAKLPEGYPESERVMDSLVETLIPTFQV